MKKTFWVILPGIFLFFTAVTFSSCGDTNQASNDEPKEEVNMDAKAMAMVTISGTNPDTAVNGTISFEQDGDKVEMELEITVPSKANQSVAVHIHDMADCGDMGKMAGGHWNPTNKDHGKWGGDNFHSGDIGNIKLDGEGKGSMDLNTDLWSIGGSTQTDILNKTIIVHSGEDDYSSQPAGNSGSRIGCGIIKKSGE